MNVEIDGLCRHVKTMAGRSAIVSDEIRMILGRTIGRMEDDLFVGAHFSVNHTQDLNDSQIHRCDFIGVVAAHEIVQIPDGASIISPLSIPVRNVEPLARLCVVQEQPAFGKLSRGGRRRTKHATARQQDTGKGRAKQCSSAPLFFK